MDPYEGTARSEKNITRAAEAIEAESEQLFEPLSRTHSYVLARAALTAVRIDEPVKKPPVASGARLTQRQVQILRLYAQGLNSPEVAQELGLSQDTVRTHALHILERLKATGRAHAVGLGLVYGILTTDDVKIPGTPDKRKGTE